MLRAGTLNRDIEIQRRGPEVDAWGQPAPESWVLHANVRGNIQNLNGVQTIKAGAPASVTQASIRLRYRLDILADMRAVYKGKVYDIKAVVPDEVKREHVDLFCEVLP